MKLTNEKSPRVTWMTIFAATVMLTGAVTPATAQPPPKVGAPTYNLPNPSLPTTPPPKPITVTGCLFKGVESGCLMLYGTVPGGTYKVYDVSGGPFAAALTSVRGTTYGYSLFPWYVTVTGTPSTNATTCMQGMPFAGVVQEVAVTPNSACPLGPYK